jgi:hypothetical protein
MIFADAQRILEAATDALTDPPAHRYVYHSVPPGDQCEQLTVHFEQLYAALDGPFPMPVSTWTPCPDMTRATVYRVRLLRECWPVPQGAVMPTDEAMMDATEVLADEADELFCGLQVAAAAGDLSASPHMRAVLSPMTPLAPLGACAGWTLGVTLEGPGCCV